MGINRIKLQSGSQLEAEAAAKAAAQDPELNLTRQKLFGQNYIDDLARGQGIAQYYSSFGIPPAAEASVPETTAPVPITPVGGGADMGQVDTIPFTPVDGGQGNVVSPTTQPIDPTGMLPQIPEVPFSFPMGGGADMATVPAADTGDITIRPAFDTLGLQNSQNLYNYATQLIDRGQGDVLVNTGDSSLGTMSIRDLQKLASDKINDARMQYNVLSKGALDETIPGVTPIADLPMVQTIQIGDNVYDAVTGELISGTGEAVDEEGFNILDFLPFGEKSITGALLRGAKELLPEQDPRVGIIDELYDRDDIGRISEGELMAGYNPVSGGFLNTISGGRIGTPTQYGLQDAYQERIDTIEKTLADKYPDGDYSGTQLDERLAALKEAKAKEADALGITQADAQRDAEAKMRQTIADAERFNLGAEELGEMDTTAENIIVPPVKPSRAEKAEELFEDIQIVDTPGGEIYVNTDSGEAFSSAAEAIEAKEAAAAAAEQERIQAEAREAFRIAQQREADQAFAEQAAKERAEASARAAQKAAAERAAKAAIAKVEAEAAARRQDDNRGGGGGGGGARSGGSSRGGTSATSSGLGNLGFSDIRLKENIELIGKSPSNINIYKFNYRNNSTVYQGTMAHEVPWASVKHANGYMMVDYDKVDVEFKKYAS